MNLLSTSPEWIVWLLVVLLVAATVQDAVQLKISNLICGAVLVLAVVAMVESGLRVSLWQNVVVFAVILTVGAFLFEREMLGGGDVKLFATVGLWVDFSTALRLVASIFIAGGFLALFIILLRTVSPKWIACRVRTLQPRAGIPYGIAIAAGTLLVMTMTSPPQKELPNVPIKILPKAPARTG